MSFFFSVHSRYFIFIHSFGAWLGWCWGAIYLCETWKCQWVVWELRMLKIKYVSVCFLYGWAWTVCGATANANMWSHFMCRVKKCIKTKKSTDKSNEKLLCAPYIQANFRNSSKSNEYRIREKNWTKYFK